MYLTYVMKGLTANGNVVSWSSPNAPDYTGSLSGYYSLTGVTVDYIINGNNIDTLVPDPGRVISPLAYGAKGDGTTDDADAIQAAINAASELGVVQLPVGTFLVGSPLTLPDGVTLRGINRYNCTLKLGFSGTLLTMCTAARLEHVTLDGDGINQANGVGIAIGRPTSTYDDKQSVFDCDIINFDGYCVKFAYADSGMYSNFSNCRIYRYNANSNNSRYSIGMVGTPAYYCPRYFSDIKTNGNLSFDLTGAYGIYINGCSLSGLYFGADTTGVCVTNSKIDTVSGYTLNVNGIHNSITNCEIVPPITIDSVSAHITISGNVYHETIPVVDNSTLRDTNNVTIPTIEYTPTFSSSGGSCTLGNGTISGQWSRNGSVVTVSVFLQLGSTTSFPAGDFRISVPLSYVSQVPVQVGSTFYKDNSTGTVMVGAALLAQNVSYLTFQSSGASATLVSDTAPWTWASLDYIVATITYTL